MDVFLPQYVNKFLLLHNKFGPAQNILGPVKGQGISNNLLIRWFLHTICRLRLGNQELRIKGQML